ncbi:hypothetical protein QTP88_017434 [Uroleucon formosanum]
MQERGSTILIDGRHKLRTDNDHNHAPETSQAAVSIAHSILKDTARSTTNKPSQIIQSTQFNIPENIKSYLLNYEALRKKVKRTHITHHHTEPNSIDGLNTDIPKTSNHAEAWHLGWNELVGSAHIDLFTLIKELQEQVDIEAILRRARKPRPTNLQQKREQRLKTAIVKVKRV